jgi:hypothetical protein
LLSVLGYGVAGDGFRCCRCLEVDGVWLILSLIFGFVQWVSVGFGSISVGVWLAVGCRLARGGLRGGSWWVCRVAHGGGSHFWSIPVVLGVGFFLLFCFKLLQTHNVNYFLEHFPRMQTNTKKNYFP